MSDDLKARSDTAWNAALEEAAVWCDKRAEKHAHHPLSDYHATSEWEAETIAAAIRSLKRGTPGDETPDCATLMAGWLAEMFCDGDGPADIDGGDLQAAMQECGFVRSETYDFNKHGPQDFGAEPGKDIILILEPKAREACRRYRAFADAKTKRGTP